jgi:pantetheine-phosphate adenylyltransferase
VEAQCFKRFIENFIIMKIAIYPGSFDPIHNGHLDVIERAAKLCDKIIIAIAKNPGKVGLFPTEERLDLIKEVTSHIEEAEITSFDGLLVDFYRDTNADAVIRGLRAISDFEYEFQMALMNRNLLDDLETIFLVPSQENIYLSSRIIKEVARLNGKVETFVPELVKEALNKKFR